jgi:O-methyltransferase involved in polyketide biosynthesis
VVIAEGLTAYFSHEDNVRIGQHVRASLKEGGAFIADYPQREGMANAQKATRFFSRQAGEYLGIMDNEEQLKKVLQDAGYSKVELYVASQCADMFKLPRPVLDFSYFVVATK